MIDLVQVADNLKSVFGLDLDPRISEAAVRMPRENFTRRIYDDRRKEWVTNNDSARWKELLGEDRFVAIQTNEDGEITSSISQPSLVFAMIQMLAIEPGDRVLEIGAASGWSAALMSDLVGEEGEVVSVEIDPDLLVTARQNIAANRLNNVRAILGDALAGVADEAFDKVVYTVGARDYPASLLDSMVEGGRCVLVHKFDATADVLYSGLKSGGRLELFPVTPVIFVELRGTQAGSDEFVDLSSLPDDPLDQPFWGDVSGYVDLLYRTAGFRFFLRMRAPEYRLVRRDGASGFGLCGAHRAVVLQGTNVVQGDAAGLARFNRLLRDWVDLGLPGLTGFKLIVSQPEDPFETMYRFNGNELRYNYMPIHPSTESGSRLPTKQAAPVVATEEPTSACVRGPIRPLPPGATSVPSGGIFLPAENRWSRVGQAPAMPS